MRNRTAILAALLMVVTGSGVASATGPVAPGGPDLPVSFDGNRARVAWAEGHALAPTARSPFATATGFLASRGRDGRTIASLRVERTTTSRGILHLTLGQAVDGRAIVGAYAKLAFDRTGALVHAIDQLVAVPARVTGGPVRAETALAAAIATVIPQVADRPALAGLGGGVATFRRTPAFHVAPTAREVLLARESGRLERAWEVTTWTNEGNLLDVTLVDAAGAVAGSERRTAADSYGVFTESPGVAAQTTVSGPGGGNAASPNGWLTGSQTTVNISGNNANAYLDRDANNGPDGGGTAVTNGVFDAVADLAAEPTKAANQAVAVQNLFYLTNLMHDTLYLHGFDEAAGNFQADNFGKGGVGSDPVLAEAQDGSGMDNANFATPADGSSPRMQMYLWTPGSPTHQAVVSGSAAVDGYGATFGPALSTTGVTGPLMWANDGAGVSTSDACESLPRRSMTGKLALIDRGTCTFLTKVKNVAAAGAIGAIVVNNVEGKAFTMGGSGTIRIPSVMTELAARGGLSTAANAGTSTTIRSRDPLPPMLDGDLDSDIVFHEYGHGLTWRMIGSMSGPMAGAIGEGASDALAVFMNLDDRIGEYAFADAEGIRSAPYATLKKDYSSMTGVEVHDDGEVYGRIAWLLLQGYQDAGLGAGDLLATWVDGFNYTPAAPTMTDMRDGMLSAAAGGSPQTCVIWRAFAAAGVGQGASATISRRGVIKATNSFTVPVACRP